jgi:UDP-glucose 4-epimerase
MKKKVFITGGTGYIGRNFINLYKDKYIFKSFSLLNNKFDDISLLNISIVIHCAALVHQKIELPYARYFDVNVKYPLELARLAKKSGVKQFIFISTIAVYEDNIKMINERTSCSPQTSYGHSKLKAEIELQKLNDNHFKISIVRPPIVNGYKAPGNMKSLINLVNKVQILPFGKIENNRSMVYIENLCHLIDEIIIQQKAGIFLASDNEPLSTTKLIELIANGLNKKVYLLKIPFFENLLKLVKPSIYKRLYENLEVDNNETKIKLNLTNPYSVEDGIKLMLKDYNK